MGSARSDMQHDAHAHLVAFLGQIESEYGIDDLAPIAGATAPPGWPLYEQCLTRGELATYLLTGDSPWRED